MASPAPPSASDHSMASARFAGASFFPTEEEPAGDLPDFPQSEMEELPIHPPTTEPAITRSQATTQDNSTPAVPASITTTRRVRSTATTRSSTRKRKGTETKVAPESSNASTTPRKRARGSPKKDPAVVPKEEEKEEVAEESCCICMSTVEPDDVACVNGCEHKFCFGCIEKWAERENSCPLCKSRFTKIDRVNKKRRKGQKNSKKVKQRDQRSAESAGAALEGLLANFQRNGNPHFAHLIISGTPRITFRAEAPRQAGVTAAHRLPFVDEPLISSEDEDDNPFASFLRAINRVPFQIRPVAVAATQATSRSYASNGSDRSAGFRAENPLEIDDDSDDDTVEVVRVVGASRGTDTA